ncbi:hypothetical protein PYCC9005_000701 [Savitreella phatthalungensis]
MASSDDEQVLAIALARSIPRAMTPQTYVELLRESITNVPPYGQSSGSSNEQKFYFDGIEFWKKRLQEEQRKNTRLRAVLHRAECAKPQSTDSTAPAKTHSTATNYVKPYEIPRLSSVSIKSEYLLDLLLDLKASGDSTTGVDRWEQVCDEFVNVLRTERDAVSHRQAVAAFLHDTRLRHDIPPKVMYKRCISLVDEIEDIVMAWQKSKEVDEDEMMELLMSMVAEMASGRNEESRMIFETLCERLAELDGYAEERVIGRYERLASAYIRIMQALLVQDTSRFERLFEEVHEYHWLGKLIFKAGVSNGWLKFD